MSPEVGDKVAVVWEPLLWYPVDYEVFYSDPLWAYDFSFNSFGFFPPVLLIQLNTQDPLQNSVYSFCAVISSVHCLAKDKPHWPLRTACFIFPLLSFARAPLSSWAVAWKLSSGSKLGQFKFTSFVSCLLEILSFPSFASNVFCLIFCYCCSGRLELLFVTPFCPENAFCYNTAYLYDNQKKW
jgi:hypothetical protein